MAHNIPKYCMNCHRLFTSFDSKHAFCSLECKKMYANHTFYRCRQCRRAGCSLRNENTNTVPDGCPNLKRCFVIKKTDK